MSNTPAKPLSPTCASARNSSLNTPDTRLPIAERLHLVSCAHCSLIWKQMRRLMERSRRLPNGPAPESLRVRVLAQVEARSIPAAFQPDVAHGYRRPLPYKPIAAGAVAILAVTGASSLCVANWSRWFPSAQSQVRLVPAKAQTWHFTGWRLESGKRVPWEVWGRRQPYLYRERIGDLVFVDNGNVRTQVLPSHSQRQRGLVLITDTKTLPPLNGLSFSNAGFLTTGGTKWDRFNQVSRDGKELLLQCDLAYVEDIPDRTKKQSGAMAVSFGMMGNGESMQKQRVEDHLLIRADARTKTPVKFSVTELRYLPRPARVPANGPSVSPPVMPAVGQGRKSKGALVSREITAELSLSYNVPLPADVEKVDAPTTYALSDTTQKKDLQGVASNRVTALGITVEGKVVARDSGGNLRVQLQPFFDGGSTRANYPPFGVYFALQGDPPVTSLSGSRETPPPWGATDDQGRRYISISGPEYHQIDSPHQEIYLVPLEPLPPGTPRPQRLHLVLRANGSLNEFVRENHAVTSAGTLQARGEMTLDLPSAITSLDYDAMRPGFKPYLINYSVNGVSGKKISNFRRTLAYQAAEARAQTYVTLAELTVVNAPNSSTTPDKTMAQLAALKAQRLRKAIASCEAAASIAAKSTGSDYWIQTNLNRAQSLRTMLKRQ